jgi:hypothetical protein
MAGHITHVSGRSDGTTPSLASLPSPHIHVRSFGRFDGRSLRVLLLVAHPISSKMHPPSPSPALPHLCGNSDPPTPGGQSWRDSTEPRWASLLGIAGFAPPDNRSGPILPSITPNDLSDADQSQDRAVDRPVSIADHETDAKCQIEALEHSSMGWAVRASMHSPSHGESEARLRLASRDLRRRRFRLRCRSCGNSDRRLSYLPAPPTSRSTW